MPNLKQDTSEEELNELIEVSRLFQLPQLETICQNVKDDQDFLNPSIGTYLNDETGKAMKEMFLNQPDLADIVFEVEGKGQFIVYIESQNIQYFQYHKLMEMIYYLPIYYFSTPANMK